MDEIRSGENVQLVAAIVRRKRRDSLTTYSHHPILTEAGDNLTTESGDRISTEGT